MRSWLPAVCLILVVMFHSGCAPTPKVVKERTMSIEEILHRVQMRNEAIKTLKGNGSITIESPEGSNSGSFDARLRKPDSLRVEFKGPFGIRVGTLMLSREQFLFYNRMENKAIIGKPNGTTLEWTFRLKMQFDEIVHAFVGEFPSANQSDSLSRFDVEDDQYVVRYNTSSGKKEYRIDGDRFIVTSYRMLDSTGKSIFYAFATLIDEVDNVPMPMLLRVVFPRERRSVTIAYDDVEINTPVDCSFIPPKQAEIIYR